MTQSASASSLIELWNQSPNTLPIRKQTREITSKLREFIAEFPDDTHERFRAMLDQLGRDEYWKTQRVSIVRLNIERMFELTDAAPTTISYIGRRVEWLRTQQGVVQEHEGNELTLVFDNGTSQRVYLDETVFL